ncbi:hypothetical protein KAR91_20855 [Candidatus Pacearchaeota archaeon]|nr:hypothetical protein [Candidatus Pacearchaeota archaeon]
MELIIVVEIEEEDYKKAVCCGWRDRFGEEITPKDVGVCDNTEDFQAAAAYLPEKAIVHIQVKR